MTLAAVQALQQAMCLAPLVLGVWIAFFLLRFPDFTFQGSFVLGAAITAALLQGRGPSIGWAILATVAGMLGGAAAGGLTSLANSLLGVPTLLCGIGVSLICYSAALLAMSGAMVSFSIEATLSGWLQLELPLGPERLRVVAANAGRELMVLTLVTLVVFVICRLLLTSRVGLLARASGLNPEACRTYGFRFETWQGLGLALSNACCGLAGALFAQNLRFAAVDLGASVVAVGLGAAVLAEGLSRHLGWNVRLAALFLSLLVFQATKVGVLRLPLGSDLLRLAEGTMLLLVVWLASRARGKQRLWDLRL